MCLTEPMPDDDGGWSQVEVYDEEDEYAMEEFMWTMQMEVRSVPVGGRVARLGGLVGTHKRSMRHFTRRTAALVMPLPSGCAHRLWCGCSDPHRQPGFKT